MERVSRMAPPLHCGRLGLPSDSQSVIPRPRRGNSQSTQIIPIPSSSRPSLAAARQQPLATSGKHAAGGTGPATSQSGCSAPPGPAEAQIRGRVRDTRVRQDNNSRHKADTR
jgi:hypothetical protein